ncbi:MAG TPA: mechanosensitive ion channel [Anaerolineae bacterium]|nr:mechanosensitive ion channel [Anaerolineae bacterium]
MGQLLDLWEYIQSVVGKGSLNYQGDILSIAFHFLLAVIVMFIGRWLARKIRIVLRHALVQAELSPSLINLFVTVVYYSIILLVVVFALAVAGVPIDSIIFIISVILIVLAIALQDSLGNLAAAVIFLLFQPFKVGDMVEAAGVFGTVREIQMFRTLFLSWENTAVSVPNMAILNGNITNYSQEGVVRLDMKFTVSYSDNLRQAKQLLEGIITSHDHVLADPAPIVGVDELGDNGVSFVFRPFVKAEDMWQTRYDLTEQVKLAFDEAGITIPFPQRDVHLSRSDA